jgi:NTE family protein
MMKIQKLLHNTMIGGCLGLAALLVSPDLYAQAKPAAAADTPKRPKICLVLSGGGARGAAHVGVLKVLEELRVPIDCITGTSMGALVGGAYATGTTLPEMDGILKEITTELLYKEYPPREELSMRRKSDDYRIFVGPEIGIGGGVRGGGLGLPKGVVTGVQLETVLRRLARAPGYYQFDKLPIPYRAVATDLVSGKAVIFKEGELANVMRASMSVPGAVAPAEFGGMMLVDGMLTSNLPVAAARAMGADIIIAVNVGTPLLKREELTSILGVTGQMLSILTEQNVQESLASLKPTDILISPELGDFSTGDFDNLPKISPLGEAAARKVADRLAQLAIPENEYVALRKRQQVHVAADVRPVDEIRFENLQRVNPKTAQAVMDTQAGKPIDQQTLDRDMRRIYGTGDFEHVNYRFLEEPGRRVLAVDAVEKSWGPDYLRFGLGLSTDFTGDAYFNLLARYRKSWLNSLGAEWRTDLQIGRTTNLYSEFYQPLNAEGDFFVAPNVMIERRSTTLYSGDNRLGRYDFVTSQVGFDVGAQFRQYGTFRLGVLGGTLSPSLDTGPLYLSPPQSKIDIGGYRARLTLDRLDSVNFPRKGFNAGLNIYDSNTSLGAQDSYTKWDIDGTTAHSFGNHTVAFSLKAGGRIGSDPLPYYDQFQWGGFLQMSGYKTGQLYGENLSYGRAMYFHRIMKGTLLEGAYGGFSLEAGRVGGPLVPGSPQGLLKSGSLFVASDTPLGPAYLGYGRAADGNDSFYFYLGKQF